MGAVDDLVAPITSSIGILPNIFGIVWSAQSWYAAYSQLSRAVVHEMRE